MSNSIFVKPAPGLIVRDPDTREALPPEGKQVPRSIYWIRRLRDRDVTEAAAPASGSQTAAAGSAAKSNER